MIIDCFLFFNELDLLEIRLEELKGVVDWFVLVESNETFSGKPKPYHFEMNRDHFAAYNICYIKIQSFPPEIEGPWDREAYSRNMLGTALETLQVGPDDIILVSDLDEIPRASHVKYCATELAAGKQQCFVFEMPLSYYYVNRIDSNVWHGSRMIRFRDFTTMHGLRFQKGAILPESGWHFSYVGGVEQIRNKLVSAAHTENDRPEFTDRSHIEQCMQTGEDLFGREHCFRMVPIDLSFPHYLIRNADRFSHFFAFGFDSPQIDLLYAQALLQRGDIAEHLDYLYRLGSTVEHITELGTGTGQSTCAFLRARPTRLISYDIARRNSLDKLSEAAVEAVIDFSFQEQDVLSAEIEPTDLLFINTLHTESQMREELHRFANKAKRYLVMHDTETFGHRGEVIGERGIWYAISEYMRSHPEWRLLHHFSHNNGLTVFVRM